MIKLTNICKNYRGEDFDIPALSDINLEVKESEFVAIMGKSGSGKSTLLSIIGGLEKADSGDCMVDDMEIGKYTPLKLDLYRRDKIAFVFQNFALIEDYTVYENVAVPLDAIKMGSAEKRRRISDRLNLLGIEKYKKKYPRQLSGGEKQRVAIARALVKDCPYLLADEPTGALDQFNSQIIMEYLKKANEAGKTIIVVTHDSDVAAYADRIVYLSNGKIESD